jgi:hypothetical protein
MLIHSLNILLFLPFSLLSYFTHFCPATAKLVD